MKTHLLMRLSLVLLFAIPAMSEISYDMHFWCEGSPGWDEINGNCTLGKRASFDETGNKRMTKEAVIQWATKDVEDVRFLKEFTLKPGGELQTVSVNKTRLDERRIDVGKAVVECEFKTTFPTPPSSIKVRVLDLQANPRFAENVSEEWRVTTWMVRNNLGYKTWYVARGKHSEGGSKKRGDDGGKHEYKVVSWRGGLKNWPSENSLRRPTGDAIPLYTWMMKRIQEKESTKQIEEQEEEEAEEEQEALKRKKVVEKKDVKKTKKQKMVH